MKLVVLTDIHPYPPDHGSSVISFAWINGLVRRGHEVALFSRTPKTSIVQRASRVLDPRVRDYSEPVGVSVGERVSLLAAGYPSAVVRLGAGWVLHALNHVESDGFHADAAVLVGPALAGGILALQSCSRRSVPLVFVPYDSVWRSLSARTGHLGGFARVWNRVQAALWEKLEARVFPLADACVTVTPEDAEAVCRFWQSANCSRMHVLPNGVDTAYFAPSLEPEEEFTAILTGNMWAIETVESATWFLRDVWSEVVAAVPGAVCRLVGKNPHPSLHELSMRMRGVDIVGTVPDLRPYIARSGVYVSPLRLGTGIKNRMLEALAMGKAVVATPASTYGLRLEPGRDFVVGHSATEMIGQILDLFRDPARRRELGMNGRRGVQEFHSWDSTINGLEKVLHSVVNGKSDGEGRR